MFSEGTLLFMGKNGHKRHFFSGVLMLTAANLLVKVIGVFYKIPLTNMLGDEGMGYFGTAYQIYSWLYMFSTAGLPVAMSLTVAGCNARGLREDKRSLLRITVTFFAAVGALGTFMMLFFCRRLAAFISADLSYMCILAIAPAFFFICISSALRGYFQGHSDMLPTALSEVLEAVGKLSIGLLLGSYAISLGRPIYEVAASSTVGVTLGVAAGALLLIIFKAFGRDRRFCESCNVGDDATSVARVGGGRLFADMMRIAVPIMLSSSLLGTSSMLDTLVIIRRLAATGMSEAAAVASYGNYTAYCVTLFNLPPALIYPIVNATVPLIAASRAKGDAMRANGAALNAFRLAAFISLPCSLGLAALSEPILKLIFTGSASVSSAAPLLTVLAPSVFLIGVMAVSNGVLQAYGLQRYTLVSMGCGAAVKALGAYFLTTLELGDGYLGMYAAPISTFAFYFTVAVMNFCFISRHTELDIPVVKIYGVPFLASALCAACASLVYRALSLVYGSGASVIAAIGTAAAVYAVALLAFGAIKNEDADLIPGGEKLFAPLRRLGLIK